MVKKRGMHGEMSEGVNKVTQRKSGVCAYVAADGGVNRRMDGVMDGAAAEWMNKLLNE